MSFRTDPNSLKLSSIVDSQARQRCQNVVRMASAKNVAQPDSAAAHNSEVGLQTIMRGGLPKTIHIDNARNELGVSTPTEAAVKSVTGWPIDR
jgi:hypothetical protein